jgi:hypothetical protein
MPSTYTTNNGIELIGTGEQSGTWGETTNTNFGLIDTALDGQLTKTLASAGTSGSPNTLIIEDGTTSDGRNRLVIFNDGSDLGGTAYVQLTPDNAEKIMFVRNSLSGERSIIFFQGTYNASNDFELPNGTDAVIKFDGAGTGAVVEAVFKKLYLQDLLLDTSSAQTMYIESTIPTFNMKETDADLNEKFWRLQTSAGVFKVDAVNDAYDTAATAYSIDRTGVTPNLHIWYSNASEAMRVTSAGNVGIGTSTPATALDVNGTITGTSLDMNGGADFGGNINLSMAESTTIKRTDNTGLFALQAGDDALSAALVMYGNAHATLPNWTVLEGDTMVFRPVDNSPEYMRFTDGTGVVFNDTGEDVDFRIESDTNTHAFFLQGSDGNVGIGTDSPSTTLDVSGTVTATGLDMNGNADLGGNINLSQATSTTIKRSDNTGGLVLQGGTDALSTSLVMYGNAHATLSNWTILEADTMVLRSVDNTDFVRFIDGTGTIFNETGADLDFRIESDTTLMPSYCGAVMAM